MEEQELSKKERKDLRRQEKKDEVQKMRQQRGLKRLGLWAGVAVLFGAGTWGVISLVPEAPETIKGSKLPVITEQDHAKGPEAASVVLVEYGDFQCPACSSYAPLLKQLEEKFSDKVRFVFRHYPLRQIHAQAQLASQAAEAASLQGKFWDMHDLLFENQSEWAENRRAKDVFLQYAADLGLDVARFEADLDKDLVKEKVQTDLTGGTLAGVQGTPTFFLQGLKIANPRSYDAFEALILEALQAP